MKSILSSVLFLIAAIAVYTATIGGNQGTAAKVSSGGSRMGSVISGIDP